MAELETVSATREARFWQYVRKAGPEECWIWKGHIDHHGYGRLFIGRVGRNARHHGAHRESFIIANGPIEKGVCVLHKCDNPPCVNPRHLFAGSLKDNTQDMLAKGRGAPQKGAQNGNAKLSEEQVQDALKLRAEGLTYKQIGDFFGVHLATIHLICTRQKWSSATPGVPTLVWKKTGEARYEATEGGVTYVVWSVYQNRARWSASSSSGARMDGLRSMKEARKVCMAWLVNP